MTCLGNCDPIVGAWKVPVSKMQQWKDLGINTLVRFDSEGGRYSQAQWRAQAAAKELNYIDIPSSNIAADEADPKLLAFMQEENPDLSNWPLSVWLDRFNTIRAAGAIKPVFGSFAGHLVTAGFPNYDGGPMSSNGWAGYRAFVPYADWLGESWYPINRNASRYWTDQTPDSALITRAHDLLVKWSNGKPILHSIEVCDSNIGKDGRAPTVAEMKTQVRDVMNKGAKGIIFFPIRFAGDVGRGVQSFTYDCTDATMRTGITEIVNEIRTPSPLIRKQKFWLFDDHTWEDVP